MSEKTIIRCAAVILLMTSACNRQEKTASRDEAVYLPEPYIEAKLDTTIIGEFLKGHPRYLSYDSLLRNFYAKRDYHLAWFNRDSITEQVGSFMNMLRQNRELGLLTDSAVMDQRLAFLYDSLMVAGGSVADKNLLQQMELMLSSQFFLFAQKVWGGLTSADAKDLEWFIPRKKMDMTALIGTMLDDGGLSGIAPLHPQYGMLRKYLQSFHEHTEPLDSLRLTAGTPVPGDSSLLIRQIKQRMALLGFTEGNDLSASYTPALDSLIAEYRLCHGLKAKGGINAALIDDLNKPLEMRIRKLLVNMERLRWVPSAPGDYYLLVNIPGFMLYAYENDSLMWSMPVVVGKPVHQTVVFSGNMKYVVFSPYWNIPRGILANETLPAIKRDPAYLRKKNMEVVKGKTVVNPADVDWQKYSAATFPYMIRQKPGNGNALGKVKFLFPNEYSIYLHDTPSKSHFMEESRSFSHGCIRVSRPAELAGYLLRRDSSWTAEKIAEAMNSDKEKYVTLKEAVPVYIGYFTTWVDSKGRLNSRPDVYGHDAKLSAMLFGKKAGAESKPEPGAESTN